MKGLLFIDYSSAANALSTSLKRHADRETVHKTERLRLKDEDSKCELKERK